MATNRRFATDAFRAAQPERTCRTLLGPISGDCWVFCFIWLSQVPTPSVFARLFR